MLEYSSSSELPGSARQLFGPTLHATNVHPRREIAQTSVLPEPTRVERQEFGSGNTPMATPGTLAIGTNGGGIGFGGGDMGASTAGSAEATPFAQMMNYSDDELAVLAESFFHQGQDGNQGHGGGGGGGGNANWWNMRYL